MLILLRLGNYYKAIVCGCIGCAFAKTFESSVERKGGFLKLVIPEGDESVFLVDGHPFLTKQDKKASSVPGLDLYV